MDNKLKVLFLAAEAAPYTKVGGLADVAFALPNALRQAGVDVRLMIPRYGHLQTGAYKLQRVGHSIPVPIGAGEERVHLLTAENAVVPTYFIWNDQYFSNREKVYGFNDDAQRFTFFSRAVIETLKVLDWKPDVIHANDWPMAVVPVWLDVYGRSDEYYKTMASLFTIHDIAYQGVCGRLILSFGGMEKLPHLPIEPPGKVNWLAQAVAHADLLNTVSVTYAHALLEGELDAALATIFQERQIQPFGILSGLDTDHWNPTEDEALVQTYDVTSLKMRAVNKVNFQRELRLPMANVPLIGIVLRASDVHELELVSSVIEFLVQQDDVQFVVLDIQHALTSESQKTYLQDLQGRFPGNVRGALRLDDERVERRLYGSIDMFVVVSQFEPSNLSQIIAMHYGVIPVVRVPNGITEAVIDEDIKPNHGTGFVFSAYSEDAVVTALRRALAAYQDKVRWTTLQERAMSRDFSWQASAQAYIDLYKRAIALHREPRVEN